MIEFLCPNGHKIRCSATQAGKAAKCPACGVRFRVPAASDPGLPKLGDSDPTFSQPEFTDSAISTKRPPNAEAPGTKEPEFEFLCPNGHRLHGPASLQGRPGECPTCGSRFRVPTYEDVPTGEPAEQRIDVGRVGGLDGSGIGDSAPTGRSDAAGSSRIGRTKEAPPQSAAAALLARLWKLRREGATVEIRLRNGETLTPSQFLANLSRESGQAVFATVEADGTVSLTVASWDTVERITLRGLKEVPGS